MKGKRLMKIIYSKKKNGYGDCQYTQKEKNGIVRVLTVQLIISAIVISTFFAFKKVNNELFTAITTGSFGDVKATLGQFEDYFDKLANESPVWSFIFGYTEEEKEESVEAPIIEDENGAPNDEFEENEEVLAVFGNTGLLYDTDVNPEHNSQEADEESLKISLPNYSYMKFELPEEPCLPLETAVLTDTFGLRINPVTNKQDFHTGVDLGGVKKGTEVYAIMRGSVKKSGYDSISGNYVILEFEDGFTCCYCHLNERAVKKGEAVEKGQVIGYVGSTGQSTGTHLHFHMRKDGIYIDPLSYFSYKPKNAD